MPKKQQRANLPPDRKIPTEWYYGSDPNEYDSINNVWRNSTFLLDILKGIIERDIKKLDIDLEDDYNNPQWTVVRADRNGQARALKRILKLLP